ncbi:MAG: hypothetical protein Q7R48_00930 [bacterium]|nr:hypothetical protein [bacterium]
MQKDITEQKWRDPLALTVVREGVQDGRKTKFQHQLSETVHDATGGGKYAVGFPALKSRQDGLRVLRE